jgi:hypothetical protein
MPVTIAVAARRRHARQISFRLASGFWFNPSACRCIMSLSSRSKSVTLTPLKSHRV